MRFLLAAALFTGRFALAAEPDSAVPAVNLLEAAWKASAPKYATAQEQYAQAREAAPADVRIPYAMALVAVQNHRIADGSKFLAEGLAGDKPLLPMRRAKIWMDVMGGDKESAKRDISELARILSADAAAASRADYQETARWLGSVMGYFAGPGKNQLKAADLAALDAELTDKLKDPLAAAFAEKKSAVDKQFSELQEKLDTAQAELKVANQAKLLDDRQKNEASLAEVADKQSRAEQALVQFRQERNADAVEMEYNQLSNQLNSLKNQRQRLESDLKDAKNRASKSNDKDPAAGARAQNEVNQLQGQINGLEREGSAAQQRFDAIAPAARKIHTQSQAMAGEIEDWKKKAVRLTYQKKQLEKPATDSDTDTMALAAKIKSINTYAPIDLEQEKKRIVESYGKN